MVITISIIFFFCFVVFVLFLIIEYSSDGRYNKRKRHGSASMLYPGLYEQVINNALNSELAKIPEARKSTAPIDTAEAAKVLAQYLTDVVQKGLENVQDNGGGIEV